MSGSGPALPTPQQIMDNRFMAIAATYAQRGLGRTMPNPSVGAVIVRAPEDQDQAEIVGVGWTQPGGRPHGETQALDRAGKRSEGATIYVTLEPCSHFGKTAPCAQAIIDARIARAVVAIEDPDARVAGRGIAMLRGAGIEVAVGIGEAQAHWLTLGHIRRVRDHRPFVQVKLAVSANDIVSHARSGAPVWVTGEAARARVHMMRAKADVVLTGIGTVLADNPDLTCRLPGMEDASPIRVVLDRGLRLPVDAKLVRTARDIPTWIICAAGPERDKVSALERRGVNIIQVESRPNPVGGETQLCWQQVLSSLAERGVTRVMVEAGPRIARSIGVESAVVDEYVLFTGTGQLAQTFGTPLSEIWPRDHLEKLQAATTHLAGGDSMISYRRRI